MKNPILLLMLALAMSPGYGNSEPVATLLYPSTEVTLSASVQGTLQSLAVREGDEVRQGAVLAEMEDSDERLLIERLEKLVEKRRFDSEGLKQLLGKKMASETDAMQARIEMDLAMIDLKNARKKLAQKRLVAPRNGVITRLEKEAGEWVQPGESVMTMIDVRELHAVFHIPFEQARRLHVGQNLDLVFRKVRPAPFAGRVFLIAPRVDASSGLVTVKATIDNSDRHLSPGLAGMIILPNTPDVRAID